MTFHYAINLLPINQGSDYSSKKLISLPVDLDNLRKKNPIAYLECFLALFQASGFSADVFNIKLNEDAYEFCDISPQPQMLYNFPTKEIVSNILSNPTAKLHLEAFSDPYTFDMAEPSRIQDHDLAFAKLHFQEVHPPTAIIIRYNISVILEKYVLG